MNMPNGKITNGINGLNTRLANYMKNWEKPSTSSLARRDIENNVLAKKLTAPTYDPAYLFLVKQIYLPGIDKEIGSLNKETYEFYKFAFEHTLNDVINPIFEKKDLSQLERFRKTKFESEGYKSGISFYLGIFFLAEGKTDEAHLLFCDAQMHWSVDKNKLLSALDKSDISAAENLLGSLYATLKQRILLFKSQAAPGPIPPPAFSSGKEIPTIETAAKEPPLAQAEDLPKDADLSTLSKDINALKEAVAQLNTLFTQENEKILKEAMELREKIEAVSQKLQELIQKVSQLMQEAKPPIRSAPSEYLDDELMKEAIEKGIKSFLTNPDQGLTADNIGYKFYSHTFSFVNKAGEKKNFNGKTLLRRRGKSRTKPGIIALLKELGIKVEGELTQERGAEFADNELMKKTINEKIGEYLVNPREGLTQDNISSYKFTHCTFSFIKNGAKKEFVGKTLLIRRGKSLSKAGIVSLLKDLGIEIKGELTMVTKAEYANDALIREALKKGIGGCLRDPAKGLTLDNIRSFKFPIHTFSFINEDGVEKSFVGATLLVQRKKDRSKAGIIALLKELNIEIAGKSAIVTDAEFTDNDLMKRAIMEGIRVCLKDPNWELTPDNIRSNDFVKHAFSFIDNQGTKKTFIGWTLMKKRSKTIDKAGIAALLKDLQIDVLKSDMVTRAEVNLWDLSIRKKVEQIKKNNQLADKFAKESEKIYLSLSEEDRKLYKNAYFRSDIFKDRLTLIKLSACLYHSYKDQESPLTKAKKINQDIVYDSVFDFLITFKVVFSKH